MQPAGAPSPLLTTTDVTAFDLALGQRGLLMTLFRCSLHKQEFVEAVRRLLDNREAGVSYIRDVVQGRVRCDGEVAELFRTMMNSPAILANIARETLRRSLLPEEVRLHWLSHIALVESSLENPGASILLDFMVDASIFLFLTIFDGEELSDATLIALRGILKEFFLPHLSKFYDQLDRANLEAFQAISKAINTRASNERR